MLVVEIVLLTIEISCADEITAGTERDRPIQEQGCPSSHLDWEPGIACTHILPYATVRLILNRSRTKIDDYIQQDHTQIAVHL